jgi:membrane protease YdiL (CAAX protease family)
MTTTPVRSPASGTSPAASRSWKRAWTWIAAIEVVLAASTVVLDLGIPTFVLLGLAVLSLAIRRQGPASLGFHRVHGWLLTGKMFTFAAIWTLVHLALFMPIANHVTGQTQDMSQFAELQGNVGMLAGLLLLSWTVAAVGEELAYRGYILTRLTDVFGAKGIGVVLAVGISSLLFGIAHSEQGFVGVVLTTIDAIAFSVLRYRYKSLWAPVLAHGFNNTIGFVAFFLIGPVYGLW